ncbi:MAG: hemH [Caulobacteraceae bacterium]|nr:hemH [Caulobacteraceae bacterium]
MARLAVVLFNLGGPDGPASVEPFLENLFSDRAIISLPGLVRKPLARWIARRRGPAARDNYALMGGGSPLLPETQRQAQALQAALDQARPGEESRVFIAMRYWSPRAQETAAQVAAYAPDQVVLLPLYPQYSTTTTASSLAEWRAAYRGGGQVRTACCYPTLEGLIAAHARRIRDAYEAAGRPGPARLLFSAHGLPEKVVAGGDPYAAQIEACASAVAAQLVDLFPDWSVCYQSRVGPLKWLGPSTAEAVSQAGREGLSPVICPIAFVSEHIETLVELDHDYALTAREAGCPNYVRVPALGVDSAFIEALAGVVLDTARKAVAISPAGDWTCPAAFGQCPRSEKHGAHA